MPYSLKSSISLLPKTHSSTIKRLELIGVNTFGDLLTYLPRRYIDYSITSSIGSVQAGETVTLKGNVLKAKNRYVRGNLSIQEIDISDGTGEITAYWFNQPYLVKQFEKEGMILACAGTIEKRGKKSIIKPDEYERIDPENIVDSKHTGKIIPIYPEKLHLSSRTLREKISTIFELVDTKELQEWLPESILNEHELMQYDKAINLVHNPNNMDEAQSARRRFALEELFLLHMARHLVRKSWHEKKITTPFKMNDEITQKIQKFIYALPFKLTDSQILAWQDIKSDLLRDVPANRFLQGDVGSGKTVVAALACLLTILNGKRALIMAPTSILANQHFATIQKVFEGTGIVVDLVTSDSSKKSKNSSLTTNNSHLASNTSQLIIGTHALITKDRAFDNVGLIVIDEQHRFGVAQRAMLKSKATVPHLLTMTATPIPRTLALSIFGDLDLSTLSQMPTGRLPIKTYVAGEHKRSGAYAWIRKQIQTNKCQVFVICPRIQNDEEDGSKESKESLKNVTEEWGRLQKTIFPDLRIVMLHGKMKAKEKDEIMLKFKNKEFDILVSTTVVEVGIDIPNATIILIEGAERYGLAQLHQLRGRVGRSSVQSYCVLFTSDNFPITERLKFFARTRSGMELAEYDFRHRGAGDMFGTSQHGLDGLKVASLFDYALVSESQNMASKFFSLYNPKKYPHIAQRLERFTVDKVAKD